MMESSPSEKTAPETPSARLATAITALTITQAEVARRTKVGPSYVNDVVHGRRSVTEPFAEMLQAEFGIDKLWLRNGSGQMFRRLPPVASGPQAAAVPMAPLPLLDGPCAGDPMDSDIWRGSMHVVPRSLARASDPDNHRYVLRVRGQGERGEIRDDDLILVESIRRAAPKDVVGRWCVVAKRHGEGLRLVKESDACRILGKCIGLLWRSLD